MDRFTHRQSPAETAAQILLLAASIMVIAMTLVSIRGRAQGSCVTPPIYSNPLKGSWPPNSAVVVTVDDRWTSTEMQHIGYGVERWNASAFANCSNVQFHYSGGFTFATAGAATVKDLPRLNIQYQKRTRAGYEGVDTDHAGSPERTINAIIMISPDRTDTDNLFMYFGTHEIGYT